MNFPRLPDGYYDAHGRWQRTRFCAIHCADACTCGPPFGAYYSEAHDKHRGATVSEPIKLSTGGTMDRVEYQRQFEDWIVKHLLSVQGTEWSHDEATKAARNEWDGFIGVASEPLQLPENEAHDALSYWSEG